MLDSGATCEVDACRGTSVVSGGGSEVARAEGKRWGKDSSWPEPSELGADDRDGSDCSWSESGGATSCVRKFKEGEVTTYWGLRRREIQRRSWEFVLMHGTLSCPKQRLKHL